MMAILKQQKVISNYVWSYNQEQGCQYNTASTEQVFFVGISK